MQSARSANPNFDELMLRPLDLGSAINQATRRVLTDDTSRLLQQMNPSLRADSDTFRHVIQADLSPVVDHLQQVRTYQLPPREPLIQLLPTFSRGDSPWGGSIFALIKTISCWTSAKMTDLMNWRNPQVADNRSDALKLAIEAGKKAVTTLTLPLLTLSAAVETVAYSAIIFVANILSPITQKPNEFVKEHEIAERQRSAIFTCWWTIAAHVQNFTTRTLPAEEFEARRLF